MNILEQIEKVFEEYDIKYFKGNGDTENIFNLPYRGIDNKNYHINIYMEVIEELDIIKFMIIEKSNPQIDINELKANLLNINSDLNFGKLSMKNDSDTIEFKVDYQFCGNIFTYEQYEKFIVCCIRMYEDLKESNVIL